MLLVALMLLPAVASTEVAAEDVEVSTTFLTFFKNGGGYIEYSVKGGAASDLRKLIDDPLHVFPFEKLVADGDGMIDASEGERYMKNLDDILTRRQIVLRGVKMDNVDVDDHRGLIGTEVNSTEELWLHITFRGHIQYDTYEFNVSGLEPLEVLYGEYDDIPRSLTVDERTFIVAAGMGSYNKAQKEEGSLFNMRVPLAVVVSYHGTYTASSAPLVRMEYDHSTVLANPLSLMLLVFIITFLAIKLPKIVARENGMERVRELHMSVLVALALFWLFYVFGGTAVLVWIFGVAIVVLGYFMAHLIYVKGWRGLAQSEEGIDLGEAISAADPVNGRVPTQVQMYKRPTLIETDTRPAAINPDEEVVVIMGDDVTPPATADMPQSPPRVEKQVVTPVAKVAVKRMRCKCGSLFDVPVAPRPLEVQCPHCGTKGTISS
jgi:hypothetical protein